MKQETNSPRLLTVPAAARMLALSRQAAYRLVRSGILPTGVVIRFSHANRSIRIDRVALEEFLRAGGVQPKAERVQ